MTTEPMLLGTDTELLTDAHKDSFPFWIGISQIFKAMKYDLDWFIYSPLKVDGSESWVAPSMSKKKGDRWLNSL